MIHPTAIVHREAKVSSDAVIGPYSIIDEGVEIGPECVIGPYVQITGRTRLGRGNKVHAGCVLGDLPQDFKFKGEPTELMIGEENVFREQVTVHRSNKTAEATVIGSHNFFMAHSHVGHNTAIGNHVILANGALLAGHVTVMDRAFISGNCLVHQFVRVGTLAFMQGGSGISKDLPPFTVARGQNAMAGLNTIGMRRAGMTSMERLELRRLYHLLFRGTKRFREALEEAAANYATPGAKLMVEFLQGCTRGFTRDTTRRGAPGESEE
jgi:UDP-N-acetylglucosamine acyltransferase